MSPRIAVRKAWAAALCSLALLPTALPAQTAGAPAEVESVAEAAQKTSDPTPVAILPIRVHSARSLGYLTESLGELVATRLQARDPDIVVIDSAPIRLAAGSNPSDLSDAELRRIAKQAGVRAIVTGSLTELAGRFSLDLRVTPASSDVRSQTIVITAESEEELQGHLDELVDRVASVLSGTAAGKILTVKVEGAGDLESEMRSRSRASGPR